jgi:hypothetical protein
MTRTIELEQIISSVKTKPVYLVVDKITRVADYNRPGGNVVGAVITLVGGDTVRVRETADEVVRQMRN